MEEHIRQNNQPEPKKNSKKLNDLNPKEHSILQNDSNLKRRSKQIKQRKPKKQLSAKSKHRLKVTATILAIVLMSLAAFLTFLVRWLFKTWTGLTMNELIYHLTTPLEGVNDEMITDGIMQCAVPAGIVCMLIIAVFTFAARHRKIYKKVLGVGCCIAAATFIASVTVSWIKLDFWTYISGKMTDSVFIDENYVDPSSVDIEFPEEKRNLIYIFLESMEITYSDTEDGGGFEDNVVPELTNLAQTYEDFSGEEAALNGGYSMPNTTWTVAAMFAQTSGLPLSISIGRNQMDTQESFFPSITTLGDILQDEGYKQVLLVGSDVTFGGRRNLFTTHGQYELLDYYTAIETGKIDKDYKVWWGYEDEKLFEYAKDELLTLADEDEPFNFTMLTVDTHFEDGYVCDLCPDTYGDNQYANVMACSSAQVGAFVDWILQQDFADNTTIVISGDHPTMDSDFCNDVAEDYTRRVFTVYINPAADVENNTYRTYTTFDNFPTTIAALGAKIDGERLGLGTNLFSETQTLSEIYGLTYESEELGKHSYLMDQLANIDETAVEEN